MDAQKLTSMCSGDNCNRHVYVVIPAGIGCRGGAAGGRKMKKNLLHESAKKVLNGQFPIMHEPCPIDGKKLCYHGHLCNSLKDNLKWSGCPGKTQFAD